LCNHLAYEKITAEEKVLKQTNMKEFDRQIRMYIYIVNVLVVGEGGGMQNFSLDILFV